MLGFYNNFPTNVHKIMHVTAPASKKRLQLAITQILHKLNDQTLSLEDIAYPSVPQCLVNFEFGIAEANNFNYLNKEETDRTLEVIRKKPVQVMDLFCAIQYYKIRTKKKIPLKFDYYLLRFIFGKKLTEIQVFHERGPRHISPSEIADFVINKIDKKLSKKMWRASATS